MKCPKGETVWVLYHNKKGECIFALTSKENTRDWYYLYECADGALKKLGRARTPTELEDKYHVTGQMLR